MKLENAGRVKYQSQKQDGHPARINIWDPIILSKKSLDIINTGDVTKLHVKPNNIVDEIAAHHDVCYDMDKNKDERDKKWLSH